MGRIRSDTDDIEYVKTVHEMCEVLIERILSPWLRPSFIWKLSAQGRREKKMQKILNNFIEKVIRQRKQHAKYTQGAFNFENEENGICKNYERKAFLDLLLEAAENNNLSDEDVRNETQTFIFGGHDTTASSLSWTLFLIASSPRVQKKLNVELQEIFGDDTTREVTLHDLSQMMYTECCIKEALRMYPSGPFYGRHLLEDLILGDGRILPANTSVFIAPILLHNNPEYFPNPETFLPERFYPENSHDRNKFSYIPFSAGPRNCIGQKFAMMEEKVVIANFFRRLVIEPVQKIEDVKYILELTLKPKDGPLVKICCKNIKPVSNSLLN